MLRLPDGMRDRIKAAAEASNRSMNAEIVARLEKSFVSEAEMENALDNIDDLIDRVEKLEAAVRDHDEQLSPGKSDWK